MGCEFYGDEDWSPPPELNIRFDRPFALAVVHLPTGAALFVGSVEAPEAWAAERKRKAEGPPLPS